MRREVVIIKYFFFIIRGDLVYWLEERVEVSVIVRFMVSWLVMYFLQKCMLIQYVFSWMAFMTMVAVVIELINLFVMVCEQLCLVCFSKVGLRWLSMGVNLRLADIILDLLEVKHLDHLVV